ncbi:MAG: hypothetical protein J6X77_03740 [Bacteroidales bacterium]|nr:hypothetical protein [Bacteroidales bacterium]
MKNGRYFIVFAILCLAQALISNYFLFSQYVLISMLPLLIVSLPPRYGTPAALGLAFVAGFVVDFVGGGTLGLTSCTLLPLALLRLPLLRLVSGEEILTERDISPIARQAAAEQALTMVLACLLFFGLYVWVDSAGTRPFWFNAVRTLLSTGVSALLCVLLGNFIFGQNR